MEFQLWFLPFWFQLVMHCGTCEGLQAELKRPTSAVQRNPGQCRCLEPSDRSHAATWKAEATLEIFRWAAGAPWQECSPITVLLPICLVEETVGAFTQHPGPLHLLSWVFCLLRSKFPFLINNQAHTRSSAELQVVTSGLDFNTAVDLVRWIGCWLLHLLRVLEMFKTPYYDVCFVSASEC